MIKKEAFFFAFFLFTPFFCAAFVPPDSSTHHPYAPPADKDIYHSGVFIDSISTYSDTTGFFIRIEGSLPTPCHALYPPALTIEQDTLSLKMVSWQEKGLMCIQVIEPFLYFHPLPEEKKPETKWIRVNEITISP